MFCCDNRNIISCYVYPGYGGTSFLTDIPSSWDESRLLDDSAPGAAAIRARKKGDTWYLGAMTKDAKTYNIKLDFLFNRICFSQICIFRLKIIIFIINCFFQIICLAEFNCTSAALLQIKNQFIGRRYLAFFHIDSGQIFLGARGRYIWFEALRRVVSEKKALHPCEQIRIDGSQWRDRCKWKLPSLIRQYGQGLELLTLDYINKWYSCLYPDKSVQTCSQPHYRRHLHLSRHWLPSKVKKLKVKSKKKKQVKVSFGKVNKANGYQICYAMNKKFKLT